MQGMGQTEPNQELNRSYRNHLSAQAILLFPELIRPHPLDSHSTMECEADFFGLTLQIFKEIE